MERLTKLLIVLGSLIASLACFGIALTMNDGPADAPAVAPANAHANLDDPGTAEATAAPAGISALVGPSTQTGCTAKFQDRNYSSRGGVAPKLLVLHYTVSKNTVGWGDVDAIWGYFNRDATNASAHYIIDAEGHCYYAVPESSKAWTQGAMNPYSISIEFIGYGYTSDWTTAALTKGARVFADAAKRWGIPIQWGYAPGCTVEKAGILDHDALGCGNTHTDVGPNFPRTRFLDLVKAAALPPTPEKLWRVTVDPYGAAVAKQVWEGVAQPAAVTAKRTSSGWSVLVDPNGPRAAFAVWSGKYQPVAVGMPRGK